MRCCCGRHAIRSASGAAVQGARDAGFAVASRSEDGWPGAATEVFVIDTLGELLRFYACAQVAFVGGSLQAIGGHNLLEPAATGTAIVSGPHLHNFADIARRLREAGAMRIVADAEALAAVAAHAVRRCRRAPAAGRQRGAVAGRRTRRAGAHAGPDRAGAAAPDAWRTDGAQPRQVSQVTHLRAPCEECAHAKSGGRPRSSDFNARVRASRPHWIGQRAASVWSSALSVVSRRLMSSHVGDIEGAGGLFQQQAALQEVVLAPAHRPAAPRTGCAGCSARRARCGCRLPGRPARRRRRSARRPAPAGAPRPR